MIHSNNMTKFLNKILISGFFLFLFIFIPSSAFASTLSLSPGSGKIGTGSITYVRVILSTGGESVNGVSAYLSYPADKLQVTGISYGGAFPIAAEGSFGGGGIRISRASFSGASGGLTVATIGFRGKAEGSATVSFIGGSAAARTSDSSDSLSGTGGGTYTIVQGATTSQTGTPAKPKATPAPADTIKPEITNVRIDSVTNKDAIITWNTNEKTDSNIEYGLEKDKYFLNVLDEKLNTIHSLKIESPMLVPGTKIHFRVVAKDAAGNITSGNDTEVQLPGFTVKVRVMDNSNKPLKDVEVALFPNTQKVLTGNTGEVVFTNVTPGKHLAVAKTKGVEKTKEIDVTDSQQEQSFDILIDAKTSNIPTYVLLLLILAITLTIMILVKKRKEKAKKNTAPIAQNNQTPQNITPPQNQSQ